MNTFDPDVTATAFFRCAPTATRRGASSAQPDRQRRVAARATQHHLAAQPSRARSSRRRGGTIGRSCTRKRSAMPRSRSTASRSSVQIGSSDRLPLVATSAAPKSAAAADDAAACRAASRPAFGAPGATTPRRRCARRAARAAARSAPRRRRAAALPHGRHVAVAPHVGDRRIHQRERLLLAMLPVTQSPDGALAGARRPSDEIRRAL